MALSEQLKVKIRHHLGYLGIASAQTFVLGIPAGVQTSFIIENAMNLVLPQSEPEIERHVAILNRIEELDVEGLEDVEVAEIGGITIDENFYKKRWKQYERWRRSLANLLGVFPNPFDQRLQGGGINVRVSH